MSKIGSKPILIPSDINVELEKNKIVVKGPKGELTLKIRPEIKIEIKEKKEENQKEIFVSRKNESKLAKSLHGLSRTLIANMIVGVKEGFSKSLKIMGTGYRVLLEGGVLNLSLGFSHPIRVQPKEGIEFEVKGNNEIIVKGIDKQLVGQVAASIRSLRPPDVYKGKGIRYKDEIVRKKPGKAAKIGAAA